MDTICRVAFGLKIDSFSEDENPMISKAKKMFSNDLSVKTMISFFLLFAVPRLAKLLNIRNDVFDYFKDLSLQVIHQKREEFKKVENLGKASNFLEMLLEAEAEHEKLQSLEKNVNTNGTVEPSKNVKCKWSKVGRRGEQFWHVYFPKIWPMTSSYHRPYFSSLPLLTLQRL